MSGFTDNCQINISDFSLGLWLQSQGVPKFFLSVQILVRFDPLFFIDSSAVVVTWKWAQVRKNLSVTKKPDNLDVWLSQKIKMTPAALLALATRPRAYQTSAIEENRRLSQKITREQTSSRSISTLPAALRTLWKEVSSLSILPSFLILKQLVQTFSSSSKHWPANSSGGRFFGGVDGGFLSILSQPSGVIFQLYDSISSLWRAVSGTCTKANDMSLGTSSSSIFSFCCHLLLLRLRIVLDRFVPRFAWSSLRLWRGYAAEKEMKRRQTAEVYVWEERDGKGVQLYLCGCSHNSHIYIHNHQPTSNTHKYQETANINRGSTRPTAVLRLQFLVKSCAFTFF